MAIPAQPPPPRSGLRKRTPDRSRAVIRILIVEPQPNFRHGLRTLIHSETDMRVVGEASDAANAIAIARRVAPDVFLIHLPVVGVNSSQVLREVCHSAPAHAILLTETIPTGKQVAEATRIGARAVVAEDSQPDSLLRCIRAVVKRAERAERKPPSKPPERRGTPPSFSGNRTPEKTFTLTARQLQIALAIAEGETNKGIARRLSLSEETVKHHLTRTFSKLGVCNRLELAVLLFRLKQD